MNVFQLSIPRLSLKRATMRIKRHRCSDTAHDGGSKHLMVIGLLSGLVLISALLCPIFHPSRHIWSPNSERSVIPNFTWGLTLAVFGAMIASGNRRAPVNRNLAWMEARAPLREISGQRIIRMWCDAIHGDRKASEYGLVSHGATTSKSSYYSA